MARSPVCRRADGIAWAAALLAALGLTSPPAWAREGCPAEPAVQLLKQQLLPGWPVYYFACGVPAASLRTGQILVADDDSALAPSACSTHLCVFDAGTGQRRERWSLFEAPAGVDLGAHVQPLVDRLHSQEFRPMHPLPSAARVVLQQRAGSATMQARIPGYATARLRLPARMLRCEPKAARQVLPQAVRAWTLEGLAALVVAADHLGDEPGCSWTEWRVLPLKRAAK